jgi:hypothetical protein
MRERGSDANFMKIQTNPFLHNINTTMDADVEWEPVIGHMSIDYPDGKVTYSGYSLYINDHIFYANIEPYLPRDPVLTKRGQIAKNQPPKPRSRRIHGGRHNAYSVGSVQKEQSHNCRIA